MMNMRPLRLHPGEDLRAVLEAIAAREFPNGAFVVCGIGSLSVAMLRLAASPAPQRLDGALEIIGLAGSLSTDGAHLHMSIADSEGRVLGGHVGPGCIVRTTAEILLAPVEGVRLERRFDPATGYAELVIEPLPLPGAQLD
jgi:predicted DNA-binding protein with PD1-like motif